MLATHIKTTSTKLTDKKQILYKFSPPYKGNEYCIVCTNSTGKHGAEVRCIPATKDGDIKEYKQLEVIRGCNNLKELITKIGYNECFYSLH